MTRHIPLLLALLCAAQLLSARTIQGKVLVSNDSIAVAGATCRLLADGKLLTGASSDVNGAFLIETHAKSALNLEISMTGFSSTDVIIEAGAKNLDIGAVYLDRGTTLAEVTVQAGSVTRSKGRTIVYPSIADVKSSATALSLFQKLSLAGLQANPITRTIAVDGGSPKILINGVPSTIEDVNALRPKDIEKIEYSRFTPVRYADSGASGFLNITLKKRNDGGQVYAWGRTAVNTVFVDANISASYHQGASQFTLQYRPSWRNYQKVYDIETESYIGDDFRVDIKKNDRSPFNYHYHAIKLKYDFIPTEKTLFSATFTAVPNFHKSRQFAHSEDSFLGSYDNNNLSRSKDFTPSLDLFLRQDFNPKNSMEVQVVGTLSSSDYRRENLYIYPYGNEVSYKMDADSRRRSLISEVSYVHSFSDRTSLQTGYQNTVSRSTNTYLTSDYEPVLTENNNYAYVRLGQSVGRVYFSLSTGIKMFWIKNAENKRHFIKNLSSLHASWNISNSWNLQGSFRYLPSIPSLSALTDYIQQSTPYLFSNGNPDLKVADIFAYSVSVDYTYKKFNATLSSQYSDVKNDMVGDVSYIGDRHFLSQTINAKYSRVFRNDLSLNIRNIYGFGANIYLSISHYQTAGASWSHRLTSFDGSISVWWNKGPVTISYWRKIPGKYLSGNLVGKAENGDALQVEWTPEKHWTIGASWMYMFDKKGTCYPVWGYSPVNPVTRDRYIKNNSNMVTLSVSYNADFGSIFRTRRRNLNNSDQESSLLKM